MRRLPTSAAIVFAAAALLAAQNPAPSPLFSPEDLGMLESPDRVEWQQPERIMDALQIADGSKVADVGAGGGWFTVQLARRVGPNGKVYAEDIQPQMLDAIRRRIAEQGLKQVELVLGRADDPRLPSKLDAVLMVDTYSQVSDPVDLLKHIGVALGSKGLLGVVDFTKDGAGGPGPPIGQRVDPEKVKKDAAEAGLVFRRHETFLRYQYLLVFGK